MAFYNFSQWGLKKKCIWIWLPASSVHLKTVFFYSPLYPLVSVSGLVVSSIIFFCVRWYYFLEIKTEPRGTGLNCYIDEDNDQDGWPDYLRMSPGHLPAEVKRTGSAGQRPWSWSRTPCRDYICQLAREPQGVPEEELQEVSRDRLEDE